jgi:hypothetical protein
VQGKAKMKKLSESRLRQIIKEELEDEFIKQDEYAIVMQDVIKIAEKLKQIEDENDISDESQFNEIFIPALLRGALWGAGALGAAKFLKPDVDIGSVVTSVGGAAKDIISGETEFELSDSMYLALKKLLIQKTLSAFKIDGMLNSLLTNALAERSVDDIIDLMVNRECETFVEYTWDAFVQWGIQLIQDPLASFSHNIFKSTPIIKDLISPVYGDSVATLLFGGIGAQEIGRMFKENDDIVSLLNNKIKPRVCDFVDENLSGINPRQLTGSILSMFS